MRGIPVSGKSFCANNQPDAVICSADDSMIVNGKYEFVRDKLEQAHLDCFAKFENIVSYRSSHTIGTVIVDNTNIHPWEIAPYYQLAKLYRHDVEILTVFCAFDKCLKRQTHNVPMDVMMHMFENLQTFSLPLHWIKRYLPT